MSIQLFRKHAAATLERMNRGLVLSESKHIQKRFHQSDLFRVFAVQCPVNSIDQEAQIEQFSTFRASIGIKDQYICLKCPLQKQCRFAFNKQAQEETPVFSPSLMVSYLKQLFVIGDEQLLEIIKSRHINANTLKNGPEVKHFVYWSASLRIMDTVDSLYQDLEQKQGLTDEFIRLNDEYDAEIKSNPSFETPEQVPQEKPKKLVKEEREPKFNKRSNNEEFPSEDIQQKPYRPRNDFERAPKSLDGENRPYPKRSRDQESTTNGGFRGERKFDRDDERGFERKYDRGDNQGGYRGAYQGGDRRGGERKFNRGGDREFNSDRGYERKFDRGGERGGDRKFDGGERRFERKFDGGDTRGGERGFNRQFDRGGDRVDRQFNNEERPPRFNQEANDYERPERRERSKFPREDDQGRSKPRSQSTKSTDNFEDFEQALQDYQKVAKNPKFQREFVNKFSPDVESEVSETKSERRYQPRPNLNDDIKEERSVRPDNMLLREVDEKREGGRQVRRGNLRFTKTL